MHKLYDALILGSGPAGLSAALGLGRVHRSCAVFSDAVYRNAGVKAAHAILTRDGVNPEDLRRVGREQIEKYGHADFVSTQISRVRKEPSFEGSRYPVFVAEDDKGSTWYGRTLLVATGVRDQFPELPGYAENWPQNIYQCLFCDGHERWNLKKGVLAYPSLAAQPHALQTATIAHFQSFPPGSNRIPTSPPQESPVTIFTNGPANPNQDAAISQALEQAAAHGMRVDERKVTMLAADDNEGVHIHFDDQTSVHLGFVIHKPETQPSSISQAIISQLGLETTTTPFGVNLKVSPPMNSTNIPGVFAAGDISSPMTHVTVAMSTGIGCAGAISKFCNDQDDQVALEIWRKGRPATAFN